jgi:hypothetical protein
MANKDKFKDGGKKPPIKDKKREILDKMERPAPWPDPPPPRNPEKDR